MRNQFTQSRDAHHVYIHCCQCHEEAVFNDYCLTPGLEQQRQANVERHKREHRCKLEVAA